MKSFDGYLKLKLGDNYVLLAGGNHRHINDFILPLNTSPVATISTGKGTWQPLTGRYVFQQHWTDSLTGSDTADLSIYLDGNLTANMCLDGYYFSLSGFKKYGSSNSYVLLGDGGHKALSDFLSSTTNYALSDTVGGKALHAYKLYYSQTAYLADLSSIDTFHEAYTFKCALWNGDSGSMGSSFPGTGNGIILDGGWTSASYGFQLAIDNDPNYFIALRLRGNGTWYAWKRIPMGDGTGASGTWNISISGNADTVDGRHASYGGNKPWGTIPIITDSGWMDVGKQFEFHFDNTTGSDYSTALICTGNYSNIVYLPSTTGTLALTSQIPTSLPASDVYNWAKQPNKPTYSFSEITPGVATIGDGSNRLIFRTNDSYRNGIYYSTPGNEALVFSTKYSVTSWIFATTDPNSQTAWTSLTPSLQIKNGRVTINKLIANDTNASYNLDVNGSANATTLYENGTRVSVSGHTHSYLPLSGGTMTGDIILGTYGILGFGNSIAAKYLDSAAPGAEANAVWLASTGGGGEAAGICADGNTITMWSPMDTAPRFIDSDDGKVYTIIHTGNYSSYCATADHTHTSFGNLTINGVITFSTNDNYGLAATANYSQIGFIDRYFWKGHINNMYSNNISSLNETGAPNFPNGLTSAGNITAVNFYSSSDQRLKNNINNISKSIRSFNWNDTGLKSYGLIAQEIEDEYPELVSNNDNGYKSINYTSALCMIIAKLENELDELRKRINLLPVSPPPVFNL